MDDAARARDAAREAVDDVSPERLHDVVDSRLAECSVVPGVLTIAAARARGDATPTAVARRAAGVQLIYEGLRLTRSLVHEDPWTPDPPADSPADVDVVAADVFVARGFHLLARTGAADKAVETVQRFGRAETDRQHGRAADAGDLEADVFELAAVAGATAVGDETPRALRQYVVGLADARADGALGSPAEVLPERVSDVMRRVAEEARPGAGGGDEGARAPSAGSLNRND